MINEVDEDNTGKIEFHEFLKVYEQHQYASSEDDEQDFIDAFVAMGGNPDKSGSVQADELVRIIRVKFEMTIDIQKLIDEVDTDQSGEIEYEEFKALLSRC
jgi:Ca2+-binding EF-hand superfamily protein